MGSQAQHMYMGDQVQNWDALHCVCRCSQACTRTKLRNVHEKPEGLLQS